MRWVHGSIAALALASLGGCGREEVPTLSSAAPVVFRYTLPRPPEERRRRLEAREARWRDSLVRNLGHRGEVRTYVRIEQALYTDGRPGPGGVWADVDRPGEYLAQAGRNLIVIDFGRGLIGASGGDGVSWHPHPGKAFIISLVPTPGTGVLGAVVGHGSKAGGPWHVTDTEAAWMWDY